MSRSSRAADTAPSLVVNRPPGYRPSSALASALAALAVGVARKRVVERRTAKGRGCEGGPGPRRRRASSRCRNSPRAHPSR
jgi:hypothetical protein